MCQLTGTFPCREFNTSAEWEATVDGVFSVFSRQFPVFVSAAAAPAIGRFGGGWVGDSIGFC